MSSGQTTSLSTLSIASNDDNEKNSYVKLEDLDYETTIALLIHLGCPDDIESRILKQNYTQHIFKGKLLSFITTEQQLIDELGLQDLKPLFQDLIFYVV